jgi:hypothetical protein
MCVSTVLETSTDRIPIALRVTQHKRAALYGQNRKISVQEIFIHAVVGTSATIGWVIVMLYYNKVQTHGFPSSQVVD